jgi:hypothetical protein
MVTNVKTPTEIQASQYENFVKNVFRRAAIWVAMKLHATSDTLLCLVDHQIVTTTIVPDQPYTGPTYGKIANTTRKLIVGKIAHEKGYTTSTGWLYATIAALINRHTNTLEISLNDLSLETSLSKQALITHTQLLEDMGIVKVKRESSGPKSNEINIYRLMGQGAEVTLWNGSQKDIAVKKGWSKFLTTPAKNLDGKDSLQTDSNEQDVAAVKKGTSVTEEIELSPKQQAAVNALKDVNIAPKLGRDLTIRHNHELERLFATVKCAQGKSINNPPGFVRDELKNNEQDLTWDIVSNGWQTLNDFIKSYSPKSPEDYAPNPKEETPPAPQPKPELPPLPEADPQITNQWESAYAQLELQFDRQTFDTWLRGTQVIGCEDGVFVIAVRNDYVREMLQHRLYRNIRRVLSDVRGEDTELRFEVRQFASETETGNDEPLWKQLARSA